MHLFRWFALLLLFATPTQARSFTCIADGNTPVPGGLPGETFSTFADEDPPMVSDRCLVFRGQGNMGAEGLYLAREDKIEVVADRNTPVPEGRGGTERFAEFEEAFALDGCDVVFDGTGDQGTLGIYLKREDMPLAVVADTHTPAPNGEFLDFEDPWLEGDVVVFIAATTDCKSGAIFKTDGEGGFVVVADSCGDTPVPAGLPGETFAALDSRPVLEDGVLTFRGSGNGDPPTGGIYAEIGGKLVRVVDTWTPIPEGGGAVFDQFFEISPTSGGDIVFVAAGPDTMPPFTHGGVYRATPEGISIAVDLINLSLPGWDPGDPITGFGFWFSGNLITLGAVGFTSPETIFLIHGSQISPLIAAGDNLGGMTVESLEISFPHCTADRVVLVPRFLGATTEALCVASLRLFMDGFESGDTSAWSSTVP